MKIKMTVWLSCALITTTNITWASSEKSSWFAWCCCKSSITSPTELQTFSAIHEDYEIFYDKNEDIEYEMCCTPNGSFKTPKNLKSAVPANLASIPQPNRIHPLSLYNVTSDRKEFRTNIRNAKEYQCKNI